MTTTTKKWIVRAVRKQWFSTDYIGTYEAVSAVRALTLAGRDPYLPTVMNRKVVRLEAVEA